MRFCFLGSGSRGNAFVIEYAKTCVMVDNGFSVKELEKRASRYGVDLGKLDAILVTHEHSDHINGVGPLARKYGVKVYATHGSMSSGKIGKLAAFEEINCHTAFSIKDLEVQPFPVPHDAREPCQFVISDGHARVAMLTDTGSITPYIEQMVSGCDALVLECNHDLELLEQGEYPYSLKQRVAGDYGHLNNAQSAGLLSRVDTSRMQHVVAAHLSEKHNSPDIVTEEISRTLGCEEHWITFADQDDGLPWRQVI